MKKTIAKYAKGYSEQSPSYGASVLIGYIFYRLNISKISSFNGYGMDYSDKEMVLCKERWKHAESICDDFYFDPFE